MKRIGLLILGLCLLTVPVMAQTTGGVVSRIQFDQTAPSLAEAQGYTYRAFLDNAAGVVVPVTCQAGPLTTTFICTLNQPLPALTIGPHSLQLSAANVAGESDRSSVFNFTIVATPNAPQNIRLVP